MLLMLTKPSVKLVPLDVLLAHLVKLVSLVLTKE
jgi:hypothetical protein